MGRNDVSMVNKRMILFAKRFCSKAPSAVSLSLACLLAPEEEISIFCPLPLRTQSLREDRFERKMVKSGTKIGLLLSIK